MKTNIKWFFIFCMICNIQLSYGNTIIPILHKSCRYTVTIPEGWDTIPRSILRKKIGKVSVDLALYPVNQKSYFKGNYVLFDFLPTMKTLNNFKFNKIFSEIKKKNTIENDTIKVCKSVAEINKDGYYINTKMSILKDSILVKCYQNLFLTKFGYLSIVNYKKAEGIYLLDNVSKVILEGIKINTNYKYIEPKNTSRFTVKRIIVAVGIGLIVYLLLVNLPKLCKKKK